MWLHKMKASIRVSSNIHGFHYLHCSLSGLIKQGCGLRSIHSRPVWMFTAQTNKQTNTGWSQSFRGELSSSILPTSNTLCFPVDSVNNEYILWICRALLHKAGGITGSGFSENSECVTMDVRGTLGFQSWPVSNRGLTDPEPSAAVTL